MPRYILLLALAAFTPFFAQGQLVQGTISQTGTNTVTIYGKPDAAMNNVLFTNINLCFSIPDLSPNNPVATISANHVERLTWTVAGSYPHVSGGRAYYTIIGNDNSSPTTETWASGSDNPIVAITFSNGVGSEIVHLDDLSPDGGETGNSFWYVEIQGAGDLTNYAEMFYGVGAVNNAGNSPSFVPTAEEVNLPIELAQFAARPLNATDALLEWETASETNSSHFEIERSQNGHDWQYTSETQAAGLSRSALHYAFVDERVRASDGPPALYYYRLKMVDIDGSFEYSPVRLVGFEGTGGTAVGEPFPNPANRDRAVVQLPMFSESGGDVTITVYDVQGRSFALFENYLEPGSQLVDFGLGQLAAGVYQLKVVVDGAAFSKKIVLQ